MRACAWVPPARQLQVRAVCQAGELNHQTQRTGWRTGSPARQAGSLQHTGTHKLCTHRLRSCLLLNTDLAGWCRWACRAWTTAPCASRGRACRVRTCWTALALSTPLASTGVHSLLQSCWLSIAGSLAGPKDCRPANPTSWPVLLLLHALRGSAEGH